MVATMALVDSLDEQLVLERLLDDEQAAVAARRARLALPSVHAVSLRAAARRLALSRRRTIPGVFYGADEVRTACAELGYWRWRHLLDSPALTAMPSRPQTVFRTRVAGDSGRPARAAVRARPRARGPILPTTRHARRFAAVAREADVAAIRYESVRDPAARRMLRGAGVRARSRKPAPVE